MWVSWFDVRVTFSLELPQLLYPQRWVMAPDEFVFSFSSKADEKLEEGECFLGEHSPSSNFMEALWRRWSPPEAFGWSEEGAFLPKKCVCGWGEGFLGQLHKEHCYF